MTRAGIIRKLTHLMFDSILAFSMVEGLQETEKYPDRVHVSNSGWNPQI